MTRDEVTQMITAQLDDHESEALLVSEIVLSLLSGVMGAIAVLFCLGMI